MNLKTFIIGIILIPIIYYLLGSFVSWNFNAGTWSQDGRLFLVTVSIFSYIPLIGILVNVNV